MINGFQPVTTVTKQHSAIFHRLPRGRVRAVFFHHTVAIMKTGGTNGKRIAWDVDAV